MTRASRGSTSAWSRDTIRFWKFVQKGVTAQELIDAGQKVKQSGISLSEYIMPGLGGKTMWREHAIETARVLSQIDPDFIRVRTFKALEIMPIYRRIEAGELELMNDDEIIAEERLLIENLDGITSYFASDHILNLLEELDGKFPEAKEKMLATIDRYLAMSLEERNNFRLGRRAGYYRALDDMLNPELRTRVNSIMQRIEKEHPGGLDPVISELMEVVYINKNLHQNCRDRYRIGIAIAIGYRIWFR